MSERLENGRTFDTLKLIALGLQFLYTFAAAASPSLRHIDGYDWANEAAVGPA